MFIENCGVAGASHLAGRQEASSGIRRFHAKLGNGNDGKVGERLFYTDMTSRRRRHTLGSEMPHDAT